MANWEIPSYDSEPLQPGKFYSLYVNKDNATLTVAKDIQDTINSQVTTNKNNIAGLDSEVQALQTKDNEIMDTILDNTARINNLENEDINAKIKELGERFLYTLELNTIRKEFINSQEIEIEFGRKEIISIKVYVLESDINGVKTYEDATAVVKISLEISATTKKIKVKSNNLITGYCLVL